MKDDHETNPGTQELEYKDKVFNILLLVYNELFKPQMPIDSIGAMSGPRFPNGFEKEGFDCGKCGAKCPPMEGRYRNISPHLYCFYVEHTDSTNSLKLICEATESKSSTKLESNISQKTEEFLTGIYLCNKFTTCSYCIRCFQKFAPEMAKNEANNVIQYYGLGVSSPAFTV
ncbi:hypothetical protein CAPTEDRAFT_226916 [Capitella teleta]|uniref:Uncharacterized protein n=1 Tax=Capitella teleta TaxID=283909 RepID=R7U0U9_CAPTE|nr:hypothetical protein CAPTEDRAFT_226916 [Capitella teleta]|eukprot:ELT99808.1 hypothetical protein CAPTEDRAFT_226916 [Capitella teleta]